MYVNNGMIGVIRPAEYGALARRNLTLPGRYSRGEYTWVALPSWRSARTLDPCRHFLRGSQSPEFEVVLYSTVRVVSRSGSTNTNIIKIHVSKGWRLQESIPQVGLGSTLSNGHLSMCISPRTTTMRSQPPNSLRLPSRWPPCLVCFSPTLWQQSQSGLLLIPKSRRSRICGFHTSKVRHAWQHKGL